MGWAACAIRMNFQESGDGIVARHRDTARCAEPVSRYCRITSGNQGRICKIYRFHSFFLSPTRHMTPSAVPKRLVLTPENTGCDAACMRLAVGLVPEGGVSLGMLQEICCLRFPAARDELLPRALRPQTCMVALSHIPHRDLLSSAMQAMRPQHMQDASSPWSVALGPVPEPVGCRVRRTNGHFFDSDVPGSRDLAKQSRIANLVACSDIKPRLHWAGQHPLLVGAN